MKFKLLVIGFFLSSITAFTSASTKVNNIYEEDICFSKIEQSGLLSRQLNNITPTNGCVATFNLLLPEIKQGVVNESNINNWVSGYSTFPNTFKNFEKFKNRLYENVPHTSFTNTQNCGYFMLLELKNGTYLAILPIVSADIMSFISIYEGNPQIRLCTFGTESYTGKAPLFSWAVANDPYSATYKCWKNALESEFCKNNVQWRSQKKYPELYEYLGWCTWEAFEGSITEEIVVNSIKTIKNSDVPVRWVIVDDGYLDQKSKPESRPQMLSFETNNKFPNQWKTITALKDSNNLKWMGIWRNMSGSMYGVSTEHTMKDLAQHLSPKIISNTAQNGSKTEWIKTMIIKPGKEASTAFYNAMTDNTANSGFDFQKVDFQTFNFWMYAGTGNAVKKAHENNQALENACKSNNIELLNCISQSNVNVYNTKHSVISRSSVDIKLDAPKENMKRTIQSFANNMWWAEVLVGDFDMYHTSNKETAQFLTVARAISGGPIYISDEPLHFDKKVIEPAIFKNGKIIRTLAPAVPLPESLFADGTNTCYKVIAPTRHKSCAIGAFNFSEHPTLKGTISKNDYPFSAAKLQPHEELWSIPKEGLVLYDNELAFGMVLDNTYDFDVAQMKAKVFTLAPIHNGWAVIGRSDKYIGGCTYTIKNCTKSKIELILDESGPIIVYNSSMQPKVSEGSIRKLNNGFYLIDLPVGEQNKKIEITAKR